MQSALQPNDRATRETITAIHHWAPGLYSFKTTRPAEYRFSAGQYARLGLINGAGNLVWRAYSIVSATTDTELEYYLIDVPGGAFTSALRHLAPGEPILLDRQSHGVMTPERFIDGEDLWMLATGTGLGPFISILREPAVWQRFRHLLLVHSVRHAEEFAYGDELWELQRKYAVEPATLRIVQTSTRSSVINPAPGTGAGLARLNGRITTLLKNGELERHAGLVLQPEKSRVMLCGNPAMTDEMRELLKARGMRPCRRELPGQYVAENYW
ncbi:ferredoxin--NADP reductase [Noviherbaspirillum sedimenti]|uniref:ferredoxin--NADP(+) reductase n=1 Tax=Noviherbaspirillum sedimenti TaxID=2320865 RepID=A0A3A3FZH5_9BURK|nr:ferredoxin--NADP reductase [Noviherbaspirillum sedimenti]RJG01094.1 ferredoxin--NADP reductase [Noviherbaspirillum sedimenti]